MSSFPSPARESVCVLMKWTCPVGQELYGPWPAREDSGHLGDVGRFVEDWLAVNGHPVEVTLFLVQSATDPRNVRQGAEAS